MLSQIGIAGALWVAAGLAALALYNKRVHLQSQSRATAVSSVLLSATGGPLLLLWVAVGVNQASAVPRSNVDSSNIYNAAKRKHRSAPGTPAGWYDKSGG